ncbi:hypothetical protein D3C71_1872330 [compost metagenome]
MRLLRSNRVTLRSISRLATAALMVDWLLPSLRAAAENEPWVAAWTKASSTSCEAMNYRLDRWLMIMKYRHRGR